MMLRVFVALFVLLSLFNGVQGQLLTCLCTGRTCSGNVTTCTDVQDYCFAAEIRLSDSSIRIERGCKLRNECEDQDYCPTREPGSVCAKYGCCTYDRCVANYTLGDDFKSSPSPSTTQMAKTHALKPSSSFVPMTTKPEMPASSTQEAKMAASSTQEAKMPASSSEEAKMPSSSTQEAQIPTTSTVQPEMTSKPVMPTAKMTAVPSMTSAPPEVKPTKETMMSSVSIEPSKSMDRIGTVQGLNTVIAPLDTRPTCRGASERMPGLGIFFFVAIGLLCGMF